MHVALHRILSLPRRVNPSRLGQYIGLLFRARFIINKRVGGVLVVDKRGRLCLQTLVSHQWVTNVVHFVLKT